MFKIVQANKSRLESVMVQLSFQTMTCYLKLIYTILRIYDGSLIEDFN